VAEEFRFDQRFRQCCAIETDEGPLAARSDGDNGSRHQFLAGAALAADHDGDIAVCHPENSVVDAPHGLAAADQLIERVAAGDLLGHTAVLDLHGALFQVAVEHDLQFAKVHRRDKKIIHRDLGGLEPQIVIGTAGKRHQGQVLVHAAELG
jgi:hypothetical protein